jgi:hypothetical protein
VKLIRLSAALAVACGLALLVPQARADYTVYACQGPTGLPAPLSGWEPVTGGDATAANACATGGVLALGMTGAGPWTGGQGAEHRFTAPAGTTVSRVRLQRRTSGLAGNPERWAYTLYAGAQELESCEAGGASKCTADLDGPVDFPNLNAPMVGFRAGCATIQTSSCAAPAVRVEVPRVAIGLKDGTTPAVTNVGGTLATAAGTVTGTLTATFDASDTGGGVYRTITEVDGTPVGAETPIGHPHCADANPLSPDPYEFLVATPCPFAVAGLSAAVDTTKLSDGPHTFSVVVEDAAGNRSTVIAGKPLTVGNRAIAASSKGRPNGINADVKGRLRVWFDRNAKKTLTSRYGRRVVVRGRLVNAKGRSIQGARIDVYHRRGAKGKLVQLTKTGLKTRRNGRLTLILPLDLTTRDIVLAYRSVRPGPITSRQTLKLRVVDRNGRLVTKRRGKLGRVG